ncbi:MAG: lytic murein transglycosylase [Rhizobiales bacterium]|nr:lytic murein transglycosylase [Hyphomicrobiales bacterium]
MRRLTSGLVIIATLAACAPAAAQGDTSCRGGQSFEAWLAGVRDDATRTGVSERALAALNRIQRDPRVLKQDRGQPTLSQSFLEFAGRVVSSDRLQRGRALLKKHAQTFARIEREFGVPGPVIVAFWGLETDYGAFSGDFSSLRSLATLAYDCRRPDYFRTELIDALRIVERGDLAPKDMIGAWAGELGQVQFTPSNYLKFAVDYDGDGRRDLVSSVPDLTASTANYIRSLGWRGGEPWLEEVRVGGDVPWAEAARAIKQPRSFWAGVGVTRADGSALPSDRTPAALLLPMGRLGPAFLGYANFAVYWEWNQSSNYSLAAAYFATRLADAAPLNRGDAPAILSPAEMREVQERLNAIGYDAGKPDGRLGETTRAGVKKAQLAFGLPPDGYPTGELLTMLRAKR